MLTALAPFDGDTILPLADARVQLNLTASDDHHDAAVTASRDAAIAWFEGYASTSLQERQFLWEVDQFAPFFDLPRRPVTAIDEVRYYDSEGADLAIDPADIMFGRNRLAPAAGAAWPYASGVPGGVRITFTAGYSLPADIPENVMHSVKLAMTAFFQSRSSPDLRVAMILADQVRPIL